jgi:DNA-directed RNA polymerase subunit K/omega
MQILEIVANFFQFKIRVQDIGQKEEYQPLVKRAAEELSANTIKLKIKRGPGGRAVVLS